MTISQEIQNKLEYVTKMRRELHKIPENSLEEVLTQKFILNEINKMNPDKVDIFAGTGIRVVFYGKNPNKTIGFRADMDALPIAEQTSHDFKSQHEGVMHACGHDGHMANLLGWAKYISENRDKIDNNIVLIFQPAEEGVGGAELMIKEGVLADPDVDEIYGIHVDPRTPRGKISVIPGRMMAGVNEFNIYLKGVSAHGAAPHLGKDAIIAASFLIQQLQTIISRTIDPADKALITIGKITGGDNRNIIAEDVKLEGTFRTYDVKITNLVRDRILELLEGLKVSFGVSGEYEELVHFPPVVNDEHLTDEVIHILGHDDILSLEPRMTGEDFSFYQQQIPGVFFYVGTYDDEFCHSLHSNKFNFDESDLLLGLESFKRILEARSV